MLNFFKYSKKNIIGSIFVSTLNQSLSSLTNFVLNLYLVNTLQVTEYGTVTILMMGVFLYGGVLSCLTSVQMTARLPEKINDVRRHYICNVFAISSIFGFIFISLIALVSISTFFIGFGFGWIYLLVAFGVASIAYGFREFYITVFYSDRRESAVLIANISTAVFTIAYISAQMTLNIKITVVGALWIFASGQLAGAIVGGLLAKINFPKLDTALFENTWKDLWKDGRWSLISYATYFLRSEAHTLAAVAVLGKVDLARLAASRIIVKPAILLTPAIYQVAAPRLASIRVNSSSGAAREIGTKITLLLLGTAILYSVFVLYFYDLIAAKLFPVEYAGMRGLIYLWCIYTCILAVKNGLDISYMALLQFKKQAIMNIFSASFCVIVTFTLAYFLQSEGALIGIISGELLLCILMSYSFIKSNKA